MVRVNFTIPFKEVDKAAMRIAQSQRFDSGASLSDNFGIVTVRGSETFVAELQRQLTEQFGNNIIRKDML